jgi:hypothetical protein
MEIADRRLEQDLLAAAFNEDAQRYVKPVEDALDRMALRSNLWGLAFRLQTASQDTTCARGHKILSGQIFCSFRTLLGSLIVEKTNQSPDHKKEIELCLSCLSLMLWSAGAYKLVPTDTLIKHLGPLPTSELPEPAYEGKYYLSAQVRDIFGWTSTRTVSTRAKQLNWDRVRLKETKVGYAYLKEDVLRHRIFIMRRLLIKRLGVKYTKNIGNIYDAKCYCGGFAVEVPGKGLLCEVGHKREP